MLANDPKTNVTENSKIYCNPETAKAVLVRNVMVSQLLRILKNY